MREYPERDPWELDDTAPFQEIDPPQKNLRGENRRHPEGVGLFLHANLISGGLVLYYVAGPILTRFLIFLRDLGLISTRTDVAVALWNFVLSAMGFLIPIVFLAWFSALPPGKAFPMNPSEGRLTLAAIGCGLGASVVGAYLSSVISLFVQDVAGLTPTMPDLLPDIGSDPAALFIRVASLAIIPAIFEELLFRGVILQSLRRFGDRFALVISALLFALTHQNLVQAPNAFILGMVMGYFALRTESLIPTMVFHFFNNALAAGLGVFIMGATEQTAIQANYFYMLFCISAGVLGLRVVFREGFEPLPLYRGQLSAMRRWAVFLRAPMTILYLVMTAWAFGRYFS